MANFLYNGKAITDLITTPGPQTPATLTSNYTVTPAATAATADFPPYYNSFHTRSNDRSVVSVFINYFISNTQIYSRDVCAVNVMNSGHPHNEFTYQDEPYPARTPTTPSADITAYQAAAPTWRTNTVYTGANTNTGFINISNNPVYGRPNRAYFIIAGGGGGGGGGGRHPQLDARGGGGGGAGAVFSYSLDLVSDTGLPTSNPVNRINYVIGGGGRRGLGGNSYYSPGFTLISGQKGGYGATSTLSYAGKTYTAYGGEGGDGGFGSWPQPLATGGVGGNFESDAWSPITTPPTSSYTGVVNIAASGNDGANAPTNSTPSGGDKAAGGTRTWPLQSDRVGAFPINNIGANRVKGGFGGLGQQDDGAANGAHGVLYLFFYYD
jgi:hypothetical protein